MLDLQTENKIVDILCDDYGCDVDKVYEAIDREFGFEGDGEYFASGKAAERKAARQAKRAEKKAARQEKREQKKAAKAEKKSAKAGSGNGLDTAERIGGLLTGLGTTAANVMDSAANLRNSGNTEEKVVNNYIPTPPAEEEESSKLPLILGISAAVILVVVIIIIIKKKKK